MRIISVSEEANCDIAILAISIIGLRQATSNAARIEYCLGLNGNPESEIPFYRAMH